MVGTNALDYIDHCTKVNAEFLNNLEYWFFFHYSRRDVGTTIKIINCFIFSSLKIIISLAWYKITVICFNIIGIFNKSKIQTFKINLYYTF